MGEPDLPIFPRAVREDPLGYVFLGLFFISLGLVLLFFELGLLDGPRAVGAAFSSTGSVLLLDALVRYRRPWTRHKTVPYAVLGALLLSIGVAFFLGPERWWPISLLAMGLSSAMYGALRWSRIGIRMSEGRRAVK